MIHAASFSPGRPTRILQYNRSNEVQIYAVVTFSYYYDHVCMLRMRNSKIFNLVVWTQGLLFLAFECTFKDIFLFRGV
jgi:hypothetical protein